MKDEAFSADWYCIKIIERAKSGISSWKLVKEKRW